eukprot:15450916-Alexandrium_andersonii.AAC.1
MCIRDRVRPLEKAGKKHLAVQMTISSQEVVDKVSLLKLYNKLKDSTNRAGASATTAQFEQLCEQVSAKDRSAVPLAMRRLVVKSKAFALLSDPNSVDKAVNTILTLPAGECDADISELLEQAIKGLLVRHAKSDGVTCTTALRSMLEGILKSNEALPAHVKAPVDTVIALCQYESATLDVLGKALDEIEKKKTEPVYREVMFQSAGFGFGRFVLKHVKDRLANASNMEKSMAEVDRGQAA